MTHINLRVFLLLLIFYTKLVWVFYLLEVSHLILQSIIYFEYFEAHCASALTALLSLKADDLQMLCEQIVAPAVTELGVTDFLLSSCAGALKDIMCRFSMLVNSHGLKFIISTSFGCFFWVIHSSVILSTDVLSLSQAPYSPTVNDSEFGTLTSASARPLAKSVRPPIFFDCRYWLIGVLSDLVILFCLIASNQIIGQTRKRYVANSQVRLKSCCQCVCFFIA